MEEQLRRKIDLIFEESGSSGGESSWEESTEDDPWEQGKGLGEETQAPPPSPPAATAEDLSAGLNKLFEERPRSSTRRRRGANP